jgi:hypothetical protein
MKIGKSPTGVASASPIGAHASIPPAKFYELAAQHVRANGGEGFVVRQREEGPQWRAWLAYFAWLDDQTFPRGKKASTFRSLRNGMTVPTAWPLEFDLRAPPAPLVDPSERMASPEQRRWVAKSLKDLGAALAAKAAPDPRPKPFTLPVDEGKPLYAGKAPVSTPGLAKYLEGMAPQEGFDDAIDF